MNSIELNNKNKAASVLNEFKFIIGNKVKKSLVFFTY